MTPTQKRLANEAIAQFDPGEGYRLVSFAQEWEPHPDDSNLFISSVRVEEVKWEDPEYWWVYARFEEDNLISSGRYLRTFEFQVLINGKNVPDFGLGAGVLSQETVSFPFPPGELSPYTSMTLTDHSKELCMSAVRARCRELTYPHDQ